MTRFGPYILLEPVSSTMVFELWRVDRPAVDGDASGLLLRRLRAPFDGGSCVQDWQAHLERLQSVRDSRWVLPGPLETLDQGVCVAFSEPDAWSLEAIMNFIDASSVSIPAAVVLRLVSEVAEALSGLAGGSQEGGGLFAGSQEGGGLDGTSLEGGGPDGGSLVGGGLDADRVDTGGLDAEPLNESPPGSDPHISLDSDGWVHGALRPSCVWVDRCGQLQLTDLDLGPLVGLGGAMGGGKGSANHYLAPECSEDSRVLRPASDIYAVGRLLLDLFALGRLTSGQRGLPPLQQIPALRQVVDNPAIGDLLAACLTSVPGHRPTAGEVAERLQHLLSSEPADVPVGPYLEEVMPKAECIPGPDAPLPAPGEFPPGEDARPGPSLGERIGLLLRGRLKGRYRVEMPHDVSVSLPRIFLGTLLGSLGVLLVGLLFSYGEGLLHLGVTEAGSPVRVVVTTQPEGASISLGSGRPLGTTPLTVYAPLDQAGGIAVVARLPGYLSSQPTWKAIPVFGGQIDFHILLDRRATGPGTVRVATEPEGALISINGVARGEAPVILSGLYSMESHQVTVRLVGYRTQTMDFEVLSGETTELLMVLESRKPRHRGRTSAVVASAVLSPPTATDSTEPSTTLEEPQADQGIPPDYRGPTAYLIVKSQPGWAQVFIDGRARGATHGDRRLMVAAGRRQVMLVDPKGVQASRYIHLTPDAVRVVTYDFYNSGWRLEAYRPFGD